MKERKGRREGWRGERQARREEIVHRGRFIPWKSCPFSWEYALPFFGSGVKCLLWDDLGSRWPGFCWFGLILLVHSVSSFSTIKNWPSPVSSPTWGEIVLLWKAASQPQHPLTPLEPRTTDEMPLSYWVPSSSCLQNQPWPPRSRSRGKAGNFLPDVWGAPLLLPWPICLKEAHLTGQRMKHPLQWFNRKCGDGECVGTGKFRSESWFGHLKTVWTFARGVIFLELKKLSELPRE